MKIGVITKCFQKSHIEGIELAASFGLSGVQIHATTSDFSPNMSEEQKAEYKHLLANKKLKVSALGGDLGFHGFEDEKYNNEKIDNTKRIIDLAVEFGADTVTTHIGVIPEDKKDARYKIMLDAVTECGLYAKERGVVFAIETGPETANTLLSFIKDTKGGVGVNLDPANFTMVTEQDAVEAVYILKDFIVHTHAKDGIKLDRSYTAEQIYRSDILFDEENAKKAWESFVETPIGEGDVDWDAYLAALREIGFDGFLTIERECGEDRITDIAKAVDFLKQHVPL